MTLNNFGVTLLPGEVSADAVVNTHRSFGRFVYPFVFDPGAFRSHVDVIGNANWQGPKRQVPVWEIESFSADDVLDHVAEYLNPEMDCGATAVRWSLTDDARQSPAGLANAAWELVNAARRNQPQVIPFTIDAVDLTLQVRTPATDLTSWLDLFHTFRFARGQRNISIRATRSQASDPEAPFFPDFAGGTDVLTDGMGTIDQLISGFLNTATISGNTGGWWKDVFVPGQLIPYAGLLVSGYESSQLPLLVYQARNFFGSRQHLSPMDTDLRLDDHPRILPYVKNAWFTFSLDGGAFVAGNLPDTPFYRDQLPEHLHTRYYLLFLLVLHQRFALIRLSSQVAGCWVLDPDLDDEIAQEAAMNRIRNEFLLFTARGYFAQVMQQEHHHASYRRWQEVLQIERLYSEVRDEVQEMSQHMLQRQSRRIAENQEIAAKRDREAEDRNRTRDNLLGVAAGVLGGPGLALAFFGAVGPVSIKVAILGTVVGFVVGVIIVAFSFWSLGWRSGNGE